jgi:hypothetical protein
MYGLKDTMCRREWMSTNRRRMEVGQKSDASRMDIGWNLNKRQMQVGRMFDESRTNVGRTDIKQNDRTVEW